MKKFWRWMEVVLHNKVCAFNAFNAWTVHLKVAKLVNFVLSYMYLMLLVGEGDKGKWSYLHSFFKSPLKSAVFAPRKPHCPGLAWNREGQVWESTAWTTVNFFTIFKVMMNHDSVTYQEQLKDLRLLSQMKRRLPGNIQRAAMEGKYGISENFRSSQIWI